MKWYERTPSSREPSISIKSLAIFINLKLFVRIDGICLILFKNLTIHNLF